MMKTGEISHVEGTPMDFRIKKLVGRDIDGDFKKVIELNRDVSGNTMEYYGKMDEMKMQGIGGKIVAFLCIF